jgi:hypothetical protein
VPREDIALTADEVRSFFAATRTAVLVTAVGTHPGGELVAIELHPDRDELVLRPSAEALRAVEADPRVCVIAEEQPDYAGIRGVLVHASARRFDADRVAVSFDDLVSFDFGRLRVNRPDPG